MTRFSARAGFGAGWRVEGPRAATALQILQRVARASVAHRTTGHAAEMAFFAVLTLVPSTIAVGAALGFSERLIGAHAVAEAENATTQAIRALIGPELTDSAIAPFVHAQLSQPKGGVAVGSLLLAWWLSSHLFASTGHALDFAYGVRDGRPTMTHRFIALAFALGSVVMVALTVELAVNGPLGRDGGVTQDMGLSGIYTFVWSAIRWPLLLAIVVTFLVSLYRFGPNAHHCWRDCVPGALVGAVLWICAAVAFRISAAIGLSGSSGVAADDPSVEIIGQSVNAVVATVLWAYLASIAILIGGEFNAALRDRREAAGGPLAPPEPAR